MTMGASYAVGDRVAIAGGAIWLLADLPAADPMVADLWGAIRSGADADAVIDVLFSGGLRTAPTFALLHTGEGSHRVVARGDAVVHVLAPTGERTVRPSARAPWIEEDLDNGIEAVILAPELDAHSNPEELPVAEGVTLAGTVTVRFAAATSSPPIASVPATDPPLTSADSAATPNVPEPPQAAASAAQDEAEDAPPAYDFLFGATQRSVPVQEFFAPPPEAQAAAPEPNSSSTRAWEEISLPSVALPAPSPGLIDSTPWGGPAIASPAPQPIDMPAAGNSSGFRVEVTLSSSSAASVLAARCPHGHATAPASARCRVCGSDVPLQEPFPTTRPALGVLRLPTGDRVPLDHGVLIGRSPAPPAGTLEAPHLVRVSDPENDISRNHAEIVLEAWHVSVRDLGSTNGTVVELPGAAPRRLRDGQLQLLEHGAVVVLADEVRCVFEVTA